MKRCIDGCHAGLRPIGYPFMGASRTKSPERGTGTTGPHGLIASVHKAVPVLKSLKPFKTAQHVKCHAAIRVCSPIVHLLHDLPRRDTPGMTGLKTIRSGRYHGSGGSGERAQLGRNRAADLAGRWQGGLFVPWEKSRGGIATEEAWKPAGALLMIASDAEKPPRTESPASSGLKSMVVHTIDFQTHESMSQPTEHFIWRMRSNTVLPS